VNDPAQLAALVLEDDRNIRRSVRAALESGGWTVREAETLQQAIGEMKSTRLDLAIVDLGLPDGDGIDFILALRERSRVPVIVLSARSEESQKVRALDAGADDYIEKPFRVAEFLARVRAHVRRQNDAGGANDQSSVHIGNVEFDRGARVVRKEGKDVRLTRTQYKLFDVMVANAGRVMTHRQLLTSVWGPGRVEHTQYLRVFMASLRQKLEDDAAQPKLIVTETGIGYRLIAP
jgi:two-component system KDP operon response regulator KdpE